MRMLSRVASATVIVVMIVSFMACSKKDDPTPVEETAKEKQVKLLQAEGKSWAPSSSGISIDGNDASDLFSGFTIAFKSDGTLTTTGTTPVWLRNDTWHFKDDANPNVIIRSQDNKEVTIESISASELKLSLQWDKTTFEGGRQHSIPGKYVFTLSKQ